MGKKQPPKPYWEMNAAELAEATKELDRPIPASKLRSLTKTEKAQFEKARKSPARSVFVLRDAEGVTLLRLDPAVLKSATKYAADHQMSLSDVINRSLKGMLAMVG
ncbi:hypothetical protein [Humisphaera borealis]|uniref:Uncharacterized protein n=1 Tax=Humisphaera borealis TaxID=2807512 RepID=A0A7M2WXG8_9BACT|nr:hypothetical protein [Humisphaera borealis]QOV89501.1 hypothetical protein IPV69_25460 [Humisphaera borealis]